MNDTMNKKNQKSLTISQKSNFSNLFASNKLLKSNIQENSAKILPKPLESIQRGEEYSLKFENFRKDFFVQLDKKKKDKEEKEKKSQELKLIEEKNKILMSKYSQLNYTHDYTGMPLIINEPKSNDLPIIEKKCLYRVKKLNPLKRKDNSEEPLTLNSLTEIEMRKTTEFQKFEINEAKFINSLTSFDSLNPSLGVTFISNNKTVYGGNKSNNLNLLKRKTENKDNTISSQDFLLHSNETIVKDSMNFLKSLVNSKYNTSHRNNNLLNKIVRNDKTYNSFASLKEIEDSTNSQIKTIIPVVEKFKKMSLKNFSSKIYPNNNFFNTRSIIMENDSLLRKIEVQKLLKKPMSFEEISKLKNYYTSISKKSIKYRKTIKNLNEE